MGIQERIEAFISNQGMRSLLRLGLAPKAFALIETTGRRTGQKRLTPVGNGLDGDVFWLVSIQGKRSRYVRNLLSHPRVRVKVKRTWYSGTATLVPDDNPWKRRATIDARNGRMGEFDGKIFRKYADGPITIRIDLD